MRTGDNGADKLDGQPKPAASGAGEVLQQELASDLHDAEAPSAKSAMARGFPDVPWPREALTGRSRFPSRERAAASTRTGCAREGRWGAAAAQADLLAVMELAAAVRNLGNFSINLI